MTTAEKTEMETESLAWTLAWLSKLGVSEPCGLKKLNDAELRDLARQIQWAAGNAYERGYAAGRTR